MKVPSREMYKHISGKELPVGECKRAFEIYKMLFPKCELYDDAEDFAWNVPPRQFRLFRPDVMSSKASLDEILYLLENDENSSTEFMNGLRFAIQFRKGEIPVLTPAPDEPVPTPDDLCKTCGNAPAGNDSFPMVFIRDLDGDDNPWTDESQPMCSDCRKKLRGSWKYDRGESES